MEKRKLQDKMAQERADILAHQDYMRRVAEEKEKGKRMVPFHRLIYSKFHSLSWKN